MDAYRNGIVIQCADGVTRRVYPRFFSYSADYSEKYLSHSHLSLSALTLLHRVLISGIKFLGKFPCPRCLVQKSDLGKMGMSRDMKRRKHHPRVDTVHRQRLINTAHKFIFTKGAGIDGVRVRNLLDEGSYVPTIVCLFHIMVYHCTNVLRIHSLIVY